MQHEFIFLMNFKLHINVSVFESYCSLLERELNIRGSYHIKRTVRCFEEIKVNISIYIPQLYSLLLWACTKKGDLRNGENTTERVKKDNMLPSVTAMDLIFIKKKYWHSYFNPKKNTGTVEISYQHCDSRTLETRISSNTYGSPKDILEAWFSLYNVMSSCHQQKSN